MENKKVRSSNLELLRVVSMMMIIIYHIICHCVNVQLTDKASIEKWDNGLFCSPLFYKKLFILEGLMPFGIIANAIFILISGYFMVGKGKNINLGGIAKKLLLQIGFAATSLTLGSLVYFIYRKNDTDIFVSTYSITSFNSQSWFVGYYFMVIVIASIFLSEYLNKLDRNRYKNLLIAAFAVSSLGWSGQTVRKPALT